MKKILTEIDNQRIRPQKTRRRAALHNLGCKVNSYETEAMAQMLAEAGYELVDFSQEADVYVVNTCSVTNIADRKSRQMLHRARGKNPDAVIVAAGCYVQTAKEDIKKDPAVDIVIGNNKKAELLSLLEQFFERREQLSDVIDINDGAQDYEELGLLAGGSHTRAFLKVQDGCNQFCSYCIIPYARGRVRSRAPEQVYAEVRALAENGYREIVLNGIHLSSYGAGENFGLVDLIRMVHDIPGIERIRLGSLEPRIVTEEFAESLIRLPKVCPHFHLSLQSGCDATLFRMNRRYTTAEYEKSCEILRRAYTHPAITTDVIVGFPGESAEEFEATRQFLEHIGFYEMHVFQYSRRRGTRAERMEGQIPEPVKKERSQVLLALEKQQSQAFRDYYIGKEATVLFEEEVHVGEKSYMTGFTPEYVKLALECAPGERTLKNQVCTGVVGQPLTDQLYIIQNL